MTQVAHGDRGHAKISPSGLKNFDACPGYVREDKNETPHPVTVEGTLIHEALDKGDLSELNADQRELAEFCEAYAGMLPSAQGQTIKEPKLDINSGVFGFVDQVQINGDVADVLDWKMGWNRVDAAEHNHQGKAYTLGVFEAYPNVHTITAHFVQPRLGYVTSHTFTREDVPQLQYEVRAIVSKVANATPDDYRPCPKNCAYCARVNCPAVAEAAYKLAKGYAETKGTKLEVEAALRGEEKKESILDNLPSEFYPRLLDDPEEIAKALDIAPIVEAWCKSVAIRAKKMRVQEGIEVPGWELAHRKGRKSIKNGAVAWDIVKGRVTAEDFAAISTPQLGKLRDLYTETSAKGKKAADGRALETALREGDALSGGDTDVPYLKRIKK